MKALGVKLVPLVPLEIKERSDPQDFPDIRVVQARKEIKVTKEVMGFQVPKAKE